MLGAMTLKMITRWIRAVRFIDERTVAVRLSSETDFPAFMIQVNMRLAMQDGSFRYLGSPMNNEVKNVDGTIINMFEFTPPGEVIIVFKEVIPLERNMHRLDFYYLDYKNDSLIGRGLPIK